MDEKANLAKRLTQLIALNSVADFMALETKPYFTDKRKFKKFMRRMSKVKEAMYKALICTGHELDSLFCPEEISKGE